MGPVLVELVSEEEDIAHLVLVFELLYWRNLLSGDSAPVGWWDWEVGAYNEASFAKVGKLGNWILLTASGKNFRAWVEVVRLG